jgi:hypothetical protein
MSSQLWVPGMPQPSLEDFVARLDKHIARFATERADGEAAVEVELVGGTSLRLVSIAPEPGYGFITLCPHNEDGEPEELVVPVGTIARIRLFRREDHPPFGFSVRR